MNNETINTAAAARAARDHAALTAMGIVTRDGSGNTETFFAHGTELCASGVATAQRSRAQFLQLPTLGDGMAALRATVEAECRADHFVDLGGCLVDTLGRVAPERDLRTNSEIARLTSSEIGWQRLASFAPGDVPSRLRTNVNTWLGRRRGDEMR